MIFIKNSVLLLYLIVSFYGYDLFKFFILFLWFEFKILYFEFINI